MSQPDSIQIERIGDVFIVTLGPGYESIEGMLVKQAETELLHVIEDKSCRVLILNMSGTRFFGSAFIESLIRVWNRLKSHPDSCLALYGLQSYCEEVLTVTHLNQIWGIHPDRETAIAAYQSTKA
ncbi:MAG: STAS domain-containing protein [Planctomycetaceae bacterium]|nr:STAS domain-containing protein [Planctomycetaceae bacterium]